jgi:3-oxoacyl-[acyl-carrier protein] reductase
MARMGQLDGKGALVTGGSRGIGRAIVERLAADGATVVFSYLHSEEAAREVAAGQNGPNGKDDPNGKDGKGGKVLAVQADQGSIDDMKHLFARTSDYLQGGLDIVVCNAASITPTSFEDVTPDIYDRYMAVNEKGPFFLIQYAGRALRDGGRIITISTLNTRLHPLGAALYVGAKGALEHFTKAAALSFGVRGITANIVSPGATETEMLRAANPGETFEDEVRLTSLKRLGQPADIANVVALLAGPDAAWISGQNIRADGGFWP